MTIASTLKNLSPSRYRLRVFVMIIALLTLPFTVYYLSYVRSQSGYFTDRSFRRLSTISNQVAVRVENAAMVFKNSSDKFINPRVEEENSLKFDHNPGRKQENLENLKKVFERLRGDRQIIPLHIETETRNEKLSPGTVTLKTVRHEGESPWLYFDYVTKDRVTKTLIRVEAKTDLNRLIQPFLSARVGSDYEQFQNILITESDTGRVIFQHDTTEVRLASLDKLQSSEDQAKKIDLKDIVQTSNVIDVALAGSNYRLFSHPLKLSLPSTNANSPTQSWITSGLVKSNYFQTEAWSLSVPYTVFIIGGFVVALIIFSWPFLKLVLAGPKDRFRPRDVYFLVFAMLVVLAVLTYFGLYAYVYTNIEAQMDSQVEELAGQIKTRFTDELTQALDQLETLNQNGQILAELKKEADERKAKGKDDFSSAALQNSRPKPKPLAAHASNTDLYQQSEINKTEIMPALLRSPRTKYKYFDSVAWIDASGMQRAKWTVRSYNTQYISAVGREYFDNFRKGRSYVLGDHEFWLEPVLSRNTGRNQIAISKEIPDEPWIVVADLRLLSLMDPVLPMGYGYAIIAKDGKVLFHSDEANHVGENLFQECDENPELLSTVKGRTDKALSVRYLGEDHRFFITTTKGFPEWSLVVFRNKQPLRIIFFELLTSANVLFLIYGLVMMTAFTVFYIFNVVKERRAWLWPSENKAAVYAQSIILLFGLSVLSLILVILLHGEKQVWAIAGIGLFTGVVYFVNLCWGSKSPLLNSSLLRRCKRYNRLYVLNAALLLLLTAILPAGSFFKYAYESEAELFIKHAQYSLATALAKREDRVRSQYANIRFAESAGPDASESEKKRAELLSEEKREEFVKERLGKSWGVYNDFFFQTHLAKAETEPSSVTVSKGDFIPTLSTILPLSDRGSIERRGLLNNSSVAGVGRWESAAPGTLMFHLQRNSEQPTHLKTVVPIFGIPGFASIGIVVLFVPLFVFVNYVVRKVFLVDIHQPATYSLKKLLSGKIRRNVFVVMNAPFAKKAPVNGSNICIQDLPSLVGTSDWANAFSGEETLIALDRFDYGMDDPKINQQKLKLVENLLEKQKTLMIFSAADSSLYRFSNGENGQTNCELDPAGRWAQVINGDFLTEYAEDTEDESSFEQRIQPEKTRILTEVISARCMNEIDELFHTLCVECGSREPLQRAGLQVLKQQDFIALSRERLIARIANQARPYYTHIWNSCSPGERQTLCHLAQDRLLSHRDPDIEPLLRRGLILKDQDFHLFNESFRHFVRSADRLSFVIEQDKQTQQGSLWQGLKVPVLVALLAIAAFLFLTQQDVFSRALALLTGLTTLIPALFKVLSMFHFDPTSRPPS